MPHYLRLFFWYTFLVTSILGVAIVYFFDFSFGRLNDIDDEIKEIVFYHVIYSALIISLAAYLTGKAVVKSNSKYYHVFRSEDPSRYKNLGWWLCVINFFYLLLISFFYIDVIPLYSIWSGVDLNEALSLAKKSHLSSDSYSIPYVSKFFDFSNIFAPLLVLILFLRRTVSRFLLVFTYFVSFIYLSLDLQKAPFLLLCIMSIYIAIIFSSSIKVIVFRVLCAVVVCGFVLFIYSFFMGKDFIDMFLYLLDRPVFGQIQGMYYIYEYYPPSIEAMFSKFYFYTESSESVIPPDVYIARYVYPDNENIVNVNTFFIGEAWGFGASTGVYLFTLLVTLSICFYILFWSFLFRFFTHITYLMSIVFFTTLPINQSLQFIIYQKYFLYYFLFFVIPLFFIFFLIKLARFK
tara:strand:+ start:1627 stop:2844 length:1218 start_codon:yes stop_codon:yes gene_type:complete